MSVISDQRDELRDRAGTLRAFAESIGNEAARNTMAIAAEEMLEAAGTICELRCKIEDMVDQRDEIERLRVENDKLRDDWESERDYADQMEATVTGLVAEYAKLREFAQAVAEAAYEGQMLCDKCRFSHGCYNGGKKEHEGRGCQWLLWARELGIGITDA